MSSPFADLMGSLPELSFRELSAVVAAAQSMLASSGASTSGRGPGGSGSGGRETAGRGRGRGRASAPVQGEGSRPFDGGRGGAARGAKQNAQTAWQSWRAEHPGADYIVMDEVGWPLYTAAYPEMILDGEGQVMSIKVWKSYQSETRRLADAKRRQRKRGEGDQGEGEGSDPFTSEPGRPIGGSATSGAGGTSGYADDTYIVNSGEVEMAFIAAEEAARRVMCKAQSKSGSSKSDVAVQAAATAAANIYVDHFTGKEFPGVTIVCGNDDRLSTLYRLSFSVTAVTSKSSRPLPPGSG